MRDRSDPSAGATAQDLLHRFNRTGGSSSAAGHGCRTWSLTQGEEADTLRVPCARFIAPPICGAVELLMSPRRQETRFLWAFRAPRFAPSWRNSMPGRPRWRARRCIWLTPHWVNSRSSSGSRLILNWYIKVRN